MTDQYHAEIVTRWRDLAQCAAGIEPTRIPLEPMPGDFRLLLDDLDALIAKVDPLIEAYGRMLVANGMDRRNLDYFRNQLRNSLDGNATYCIEEMAEQLAEDMAEQAA